MSSPLISAASSAFSFQAISAVSAASARSRSLCKLEYSDARPAKNAATTNVASRRARSENCGRRRLLQQCNCCQVRARAETWPRRARPFADAEGAAPERRSRLRLRLKIPRWF